MDKTVILIFYYIVGIICSSTLLKTFITYPLWDWKFDNLEWVQAWLKMTVLDYYGAAFALSGIALTENVLWEGIAWSLGFCILGSPICCAYMLYRTLKNK